MALFGRKREERGLQLAATAALVIAAVSLFFFTKDYEADFPGSVILRDRTATVLATGDGMDKMLLVNGVGMTSLTPITKMMAHFTLVASAAAAAECADHLLWHGYDVPLGACRGAFR